MLSRIDLKHASLLLKKRLLGKLAKPGFYPTDIEGLQISRRDTPSEISKCFYKPMIAMFVQGNKRILFGGNEYICKENDLVIAGIEVPVSSSIIKASSLKPHLAIALDLDMSMLSQIAIESPQNNLADSDSKSVLTQHVDADIADAFLRLLELLDKPEHIPALAAQIKREIYYRLLTGPNGAQLRSFYALGSQNHQIARSIMRLKQSLSKPVKIEELAKHVNMAASTFHRHFKEITTLSPIQYQKRLRLQEAQRLMLADNMSASASAFSVGYENFGQFSREYKRLFGEPPRKNIMRIKGKG
ncbi:MAG: AraC family transcriptional regulator [Endomicrobium sp.]|jgi:AraC-like DNA-binding protein|nr:AraC family transcriptional regulator [Endomicrobium sp.]